MYKKYIPLLFLYIALAVSVPGQNTLSNHRSGPGDSKSTNRLEPQLVSVLGNDHRSAADPLSRPRIAKPTSSAVRSSVVVNTTADERTAFNLINRVRSEHGLQPLVWNDEIAAISRIHSQNMADYNFFSHKGLDSKMVSDRADELGSRKWRAIGENIAFNRGFPDGKFLNVGVLSVIKRIGSERADFAL